MLTTLSFIKANIKSYLKFFILIFLFIYDSILLALFLFKKPSKEVEVCTVRLDAIGDFVLWLDSAKNIKNINFNKRILLIANSQWIDFAKTLNYWDEFIGVDVKKYSENLHYRYQKNKEIKSWKSKNLIHPTFSRVFETGDSIVRMSNSEQKIGCFGNTDNISILLKCISDKWYSRLIKNISHNDHELKKNNNFLNAISEKKFSLKLPQIPRNHINSSVFEKNKREYFVVTPGASWIGKIWPEKNFSDVIRYVAENSNLVPVLTGSIGEVELCKRVARYSGVECKNLSGRTSLIQLVELIRGAKFLIGNDSSAIHIATAVNTLGFCVVGGGHFNRFLPYPVMDGSKLEILSLQMPCFNCNWKCSRTYDRSGPVPCIAGIDKEALISKLKSANVL